VAKKTRTPAPPRAVQAPKRRTGTPTAGADARRQRLILYALGGSGFVALAVVIVVGALILTRGGGAANAATAKSSMVAAGCTFNHYPQQPRNHVPLNYKFHYNSFPATSGPHYFQWVIWGMYTEPVRQIQQIHNLEHGGIVIQYGTKVPRSDVEKITSFYRSDDNAMLVAPFPKLGNKIAIEAWTYLSTCTRFNQKAFTKFRDGLRYHGPEHYPKSFLQPGQ
jgi:Protein of unknown function (DUF3105)